MSHPEPEFGSFEPRRPALVALATFVIAALTLCWPMLAGRWLLRDLRAHPAGFPAPTVSHGLDAGLDADRR